MFEKLPDWIDPVHCAEHNMRFKSHVKPQAMKRLAQQVKQLKGDVEVEVSFSYHAELKTPQLHLRVKTELVLECQRSLEDFVHVVDAETHVVFLESMALQDEMEETDYEVLELPQGKISLLELVEDEVLLNIPMIPKKADETLEWQDTHLPQDEVEKENPFEQLAKLKQTLKN